MTPWAKKAFWSAFAYHVFLWLGFWTPVMEYFAWDTLWFIFSLVASFVIFVAFRKHMENWYFEKWLKKLPKEQWPTVCKTFGKKVPEE